MRLDQMLHGYSDGHRLLAGSTELPRAAKHLMLTLSDMSGRSIVNGFEEYITAYPVLEAGCYAFARTWYAFEMERPGCVWTHTLLLENAALGQVGDLADLEILFRRPTNTTTFDDYALPMEVDIQSVARPRSLKPLMPELVSALYATPNLPVLIPVDSPDVLSDLILAMWAQQWCELRSSFSFCTGSMSSRSLGGRAFDVQLIPNSVVREIRRDLPTAILLDEAVPSFDRMHEWVSVAAQDLAWPNALFRESLSKYGALLSRSLRGRPSFEPAIELSLCVGEFDQEPITLQGLVDLIATRFPSPAQGASLKATLLGSSEIVNQLFEESYGEVDLLVALATTAHGYAFDAAELGIGKRVSRLWAEHRDDAERLVDQLLSRNHNALGEMMLARVISAVSSDQIAVLFGSRPTILLSAVRRDPRIATSPSIWTGSADRQRELFDAATAGREIDDLILNGVVAAMLGAKTDAPAQQVFDRFGDSAVVAVLSWVDGHRADIGSEWRRGLRRHSGAVARWLSASARPSSTGLVLAAQVLNPHALDVKDVSLEMWHAGVENSSHLADDARIQLHAFSLALAFEIKSPQACALVVATFETVHGAVATRRLGYETWAFFEDHLPLLSLFRNWDKCERLRRGLVDRFENNKWPVVEFIRCAKHLDLFMSLLETCNDYSFVGSRLLERMRQHESAVLAALPSDWRDTAWRYISRHSSLANLR